MSLERIQRKLAEHMLGSASPPLVLEGALMLLSDSMTSGDDALYPSAVLRRLATFPWTSTSDAELRGELERMAAAAAKSEHELFVRFRDAEMARRTISDEPSSFEWRLRSDFWLELVESMIRSRQAEDRAAAWKERIAQKPAHAELYRFAYLEIMRTAGGKSFAPELLRPLLERQDLPPAEQLWRHMLVVTALEQAGMPEENPVAAELKGAFIERLRTTAPVPASSAEHLLDPPRLLFRHSRPAFRAQVINALLEHKPRVVAQLAGMGGVASHESWRWFLAKRESVDFAGVPLSSAVADMIGRVKLPLWVDRKVYDDHTPVRLRATGTWFELFERVLQHSQLEAQFLRPDVLWVGPRKTRESAARLLATAHARSRMAEALATPIEFEFVDFPVRGALEYFGDAQGVPVVTVWEDDRLKEPLTGQLFDVPGYLGLTIIAELASLDWDTLERVVVVGPAERFQEFRRIRSDYDRRLIEVERLKLDGNPLGHILSGSVDVEFHDHPLHQATAFLSDSQGVTIAIASLAQQDAPISLTYSGESLALVLTLMLVDPGLTWDTDGHIVLIGDSAMIERFRKRAAGREERRREYPAPVGDALKRPLKLRLHDETVQKVVNALQEQLGAPIRLDGEVRRLTDRRTSLPLKNVPLDVALDVLALQLGGKWQTTPEGEVVIDSAALGEAEPQPKAPAPPTDRR